jgi:mevalonate kinase
MPSEQTILYSEFESYTKVHSEFGKVVTLVEADPRFKPTFDHAVVKYKTRNVNEYTFWIVNDIEEITFFVIQNTKESSIKIIDFVRKAKEQLKPLVSNVVNQLSDTTQTTKLSVEEHKVAELVQNAIKLVKK